MNTPINSTSIFLEYDHIILLEKLYPIHHLKIYFFVGLQKILFIIMNYLFQKSLLPYFRFLLLFIILSTNLLVSAQYSDKTNDTIIFRRLNSIQNTIELPYSSILLDLIKERIYPNETLISESISKFFHFKTLFESEASKYNMPSEIIYLPYAISMMDNRYSGKFGTAGIWGLTATVAARYGLAITPFVDERLSVEKSTKAAFKYLNSLFELYGDWWSTIIAFANSPAGYNAAIIRINDPEYTVWDLYQKSHLPFKDIIPNYIYTVYLGNFFTTYDITVKPYKKTNSSWVYVYNNINISDLTDKTAISEDLFLQLNPVFVSSKIPGDSLFKVFLPEDSKQKFYQWEDSLYFWGISNRDSELLEDSLEADDDDEIMNSDSTESESNLDLETLTSKPIQKTVVEKKEQRIVYIVKSGDVLGRIADKYGVSVNTLKEWNNLKNDIIHPEQRIIIYKKTNSKISSAKSSTSKKTEYIYYVVKKGDSLWKIASQYSGVNDADIRELNKIGNSIHPGQVLKIKVKN